APMARAAGLYLNRTIENPRRRSGPTAWRLRFQSCQWVVLHCGWHTGESRKPHRGVDNAHGNESHQQRYARCRYATLEDGKEPDAVRSRSNASAEAVRRCAMSKFVREELMVDGIKTV